MNVQEHWESIYTSKPREKMGWFRPHLDTSLALIEELSIPKTAPILDVGCGVSTLVDDLLQRGFTSLSLLDVSQVALQIVKDRLGPEAERVEFIEGNVLETFLPPSHYDLWHDRAVFHFLTEAEQRETYRKNLLKALRPEAHVIIGTFSPEAPPKCSGLPVHRYSKDELVEALGDEFTLHSSRSEFHVSPGGVNQPYVYCHFIRSA